MNLLIKFRNYFSILLLIALGTSTYAQDKEAGIRAIEVEQYEKAKSIFNNLIKENSSDASFYFFLGNAYLGSDQEDSARIFYLKGNSVNPLNSLPFIGLGLLDLGNNKAELAKNNFDKAISLSPNDPLVYLFIGMNYTKSTNKNLDLALSNLAIAKKIDANNPEIWCAIGDVFIEKNDGTNAVQNFEQAIKLNPKFVKAYVRMGALWTRALNYQLAKDNFNKALELDVNYPPIYRDLGELEFKAKHYKDAIDNYKKFVQLTDNSVNTQVRYASFLFLNKEYKDAYDVITNLMKKDSSRVLMYRLLAYSAYELKNYEKGLPAMEKFFELAEAKRIIPSDYSYLGKLQVKNKMDSVGILSIKKAMELSPEDVDLYGDLAEAYASSKNYKAAIENYEIKFEKKKPNAIDYYYYGNACLYGNELVKADSAFVQVIKSAPNFIAAWSKRAVINSNLDPDNSLGLAKPFYEKVVELGELDAVKNKKDLINAYEYLGGFYFEKDKAMAKDFFTRLKNIDPENVKATQFLSQSK